MSEHTRNQIFLERYPKNVFFQNVHFGPIRWVPKRMRMLSIRGNDIFFGHWAYEETISSHTEHTPNEFSRMLSQRKNVNSFYMYNLCWAYGEMILSHPEHTRKLSKRRLSIRGNDLIAHWAYAEMFKSQISQPNRKRFSKISCYRTPNYKDSVSAKKLLK